jgi:DNA-directed RNA polymerase specialized sigma subunit
MATVVAFRSAGSRDQCVSQYLDTVSKIARRVNKRFPPPLTEFDDLVSVGAIALIEAADENSPYFARRIRQRIQGAMMDSFTGEPYRWATGKIQLVDVGAPARVISDLRLEIESLPALEGQILLRRLDGYTQEEIAGHIQMSRDEVRAIENRAVSRLKKRQNTAISRAA